MNKSIIIVGMGPGLGMGLAEKFGSEGFQIGMISKNQSKLEGYQKLLAEKGIDSKFHTANASDPFEIRGAIETLAETLAPVHVVEFNVVSFRFKHILEDDYSDLQKDFQVNVLGLLEAAKASRPFLSKNQGAFLVTGGASALYPDPSYGSMSLAKVAGKNLTAQLAKAFSEEHIFVSTLIVSGQIKDDSDTHSPKTLAEKFFEIYTERKDAEVIY